MLEVSTCTSISSLSITSTPIEPNNSSMVVTSLRCGKFPTVNGVSAKREAARIGRAEFFAPEAYISPESFDPPLINSLSI